MEDFSYHIVNFLTFPDMYIDYCYVHKYPTTNVAVQQAVRDNISRLRLNHLPKQCSVIVDLGKGRHNSPRNLPDTIIFYGSYNSN